MDEDIPEIWAYLAFRLVTALISGMRPPPPKALTHMLRLN